jgi:hypothetical protein
VLVAQARAEGYDAGRHHQQPTPYHGYYYRILTQQGKDAPGGAYDYMANGHMIGGFALVAFPATYGDSGVMTFIAMGEPRQRAVHILGFQHQSRRRGSCASGRMRTWIGLPRQHLPP